MCKRIFAVLFAAASIFPAVLSAQSLWKTTRHKPAIGLEWLHPNFKDNDERLYTTTYSGWVGCASLQVPLSQKMLFVTEWPFVHGHVSSQSSLYNYTMNTKQSYLGNPYLGFEITEKNAAYVTRVGVRLPLAPEDKLIARSTGFFTDYDRFEAFLSDYLPIMISGSYRQRDASGLQLKLIGGMSALIYVGDARGADRLEVFLNYSPQFEYVTKRVALSGGITGRLLMTESGDMSGRSIHQLGIQASFAIGRVWPGVHFRAPLDDSLRAFLKSVWGANVSLEL